MANQKTFQDKSAGRVKQTVSLFSSMLSQNPDMTGDMLANGRQYYRMLSKEVPLLLDHRWKGTKVKPRWKEFSSSWEKEEYKKAAKRIVSLDKALSKVN